MARNSYVHIPSMQALLTSSIVLKQGAGRMGERAWCTPENEGRGIVLDAMLRLLVKEEAC